MDVCSHQPKPTHGLTCTQLAHSRAGHQARMGCQVVAQRNGGGPHVQAN